MRLKRKLRKGFTLVELVVVIAVIAILAAVSVGAYFGVTDSANSSNATAGAKQVKDLWTMFSVGEYDNNKTLEQNAQDFCLDYVVKNGPDYYVNYAIVDIDAVSSDDESVQGMKNNEVKRANSLEEASGVSLLFKIETTYPSWFIVNDLRIVEEGGPSKSEVEFNSSFEGSRLSESYETSALNGKLDFKIETIGTDAEGKLIRGFKYYEISINDSKYADTSVDPSNKVHKLFTKPGASLKDSDLRYAPDYASVNGVATGNSTFKLLDENNDEYYSDSPINIPENSDFEKIESPDYMYSYIVGKTSFKYVDLSQAGQNLENFPICITTVKFSDQVVSDEIIPGIDKTVLGITAKTQTIKKVYGLENININFYQNENLLNDIIFNQYSQDDSAIFVFVKNAVISKEITIPNNVALITCDFKSNGNESDVAIIKNIIAENYATKITQYEQYLVPFINKWRDMPGANPNPVIKLIDENFSSITGKIIGNARNRNLKTDETDVVSTLRITNTGHLIFEEGSYLMNEANLLIASGGASCLQSEKRGKIINDGTITLSSPSEGSSLKGARFRSLGETIGSGRIIANSGTEVLELMKFVDFYGGSNAKAAIDAKVFPFIDYRLDGIQCFLELKYGCEYYSMSSMAMGGVNFITQPICLLSSNANTDGLFTITEGAIAEKTYKNDKTIISLLKGVFNDGALKVEFNGTGIVGALAGAVKVNSYEMNFPIANFDINIEETATLNLCYKSGNTSATYELYPSSKIHVKNGATLNIYNGVKVAILGQSTFKTILDGINREENPLPDVGNPNHKEIFTNIANSDIYSNSSFLIDGTVNVGLVNDDQSINSGYLFTEYEEITDGESVIGYSSTNIQNNSNFNVYSCSQSGYSYKYLKSVDQDSYESVSVLISAYPVGLNN